MAKVEFYGMGGMSALPYGERIGAEPRIVSERQWSDLKSMNPAKSISYGNGLILWGVKRDKKR